MSKDHQGNPEAVADETTTAMGKETGEIVATGEMTEAGAATEMTTGNHAGKKMNKIKNRQYKAVFSFKPNVWKAGAIR